MSLTDFYDALDRHDWYYAYSDDYRVYNLGSSRAGELQRTAKLSPEHQALYDAMEAHHTKKGPKPERAA